MFLVSFLGYMLSNEKYHTDPNKEQAVKDWPTPCDKKQLQRCLGFVNFYRHFIKSYSQIAAPLTELTSCKTSFQWSPETNFVFFELKKRFCSAPTLRHADPKMPFFVEVDASDIGAGALLP